MVPNLLSKREVRALFQKYRLYPSKRLGQNFLIDKSVVKKIIKTAEIRPQDIVLEIGPGPGALTIELAKLAKKVTAVEKDERMVRILNNELRIMGVKNVEVIQGDVLKILNSEFLTLNSYKVVANLPFYLTAPVIRKLLESKNPPKEMLLMVQKEVAQRICAKPPNMNLLAVSVQFYAKPEIISYVSKKSFWPQPKVDSAILKISNIQNPGARASSVRGRQKSKITPDIFFKIVKAGFSQPRKQILNNLAMGLKLDKERAKNWLLKNNIKPTERAERLNIKNWIGLTKSFNSECF